MDAIGLIAIVEVNSNSHSAAEGLQMISKMLK